MKLRIIDLMNKIANNEEIPKKIKYRDKIWEYTSTIFGKGYQYYSIFHEEWRTLQNQVYLEECLNDEVEIIEEDKKIEKWGQHALEEMKNCTNYTIKDLQEYIMILANTQNEIIDEINKLKE